MVLDFDDIETSTIALEHAYTHVWKHATNGYIDVRFLIQQFYLFVFKTPVWFAKTCLDQACRAKESFRKFVDSVLQRSAKIRSLVADLNKNYSDDSMAMKLLNKIMFIKVVNSYALFIYCMGCLNFRS